MRTASRWTFLLLVTAFAAAAASCGKKTEEALPSGGAPATNQTPPVGEAQPAPGEPATAAPGEAREHAGAVEHEGQGDAGEKAAPAGTPKEIWEQIAHEQAELDAVIRKAELAAVHHHAYAIRDLVVAAAGKAPELPASDAAKLQNLVESVKTLAGKLDNAGDNGDLTGVKQQYASMQVQLEAIAGLIGVR